MIVPAHLRLTLFCAVVHNIGVLEGRACVFGSKEEMDLDIENLQELVDLEILAIHPTPQTGGDMVGFHRVYSAGDRWAFGNAMETAFNDTFADGVLPEHPGLWEIGEMTEKTIRLYGENRGSTATIPAITSGYGEKLTVHGPDLEQRGSYKYRTGQYVGDTEMTGSMLAVLRCVIEHDVYSAGHIFVNRKDGGKAYQGGLDHNGLYTLIRFGLVKARGLKIDKWSSEHYEATERAQAFYDLAYPYLDRMARQDRWNEMAIVMGWK